MIWLRSKFSDTYVRQFLIWFYVTILILIIFLVGFFAFASEDFYGSTNPFS